MSDYSPFYVGEDVYDVPQTRLVPAQAVLELLQVVAVDYINEQVFQTGFQLSVPEFTGTGAQSTPKAEFQSTAIVLKLFAPFVKKSNHPLEDTYFQTAEVDLTYGRAYELATEF